MRSDLPSLTEPIGDWVEQGECRKQVRAGNADPSWWFPTAHTSMRNVNTAKTICEQCPVKQQCLEWACNHEQYGIWGGVGPKHREFLGRDRKFKKFCLVCSEVFYSDNYHKAYCSEDCHKINRAKFKREYKKQRSWRNDPMKVASLHKVCPVCDKPFMGKNVSAIYCSVGCKEDRRSQRLKDRRAKLRQEKKNEGEIV